MIIDIVLKTELNRINNEYIRTLTKLKELFSDIYFDNFDKDNGLRELSKEAMELTNKEICCAKECISPKNTEDRGLLTYC